MRMENNRTSWKSLYTTLIFTLVMFAGLDAFAWGPATHLYIAYRIFGEDQPASLYGSMVPDMCDIEVFNRAAKGAFKHITHYDYDRLAPSPFARGFATHNQKWGGDSYAHAYLVKELTAEYPKVIFEQLSRETGISVHQAEDCIEMVLEYAIRRDLGPEFGKLVASSPDAVGKAEEDALVKAFAKPFSEKVAGLSEAEAAEHIRIMFSCHRLLTKCYGRLMTLDEELLRPLGPVAVMIYLKTSKDRANTIFERACELCEDWQEHLDIIADEIAVHVKSMP